MNNLPTHKIVNGIKVDLTAEEIAEIQSKWKQAELDNAKVKMPTQSEYIAALFSRDILGDNGKALVELQSRITK